MPNRQLENLVKIGKLKTAPATEQEIAGLIHSGRVRLLDAKNTTLIIESRFDLAYNSAHTLALAALWAAGYRSENRYMVFQCLQHTLNLESAKWRVLDQAHRVRNLAEYEGETNIERELLNALLRVADDIVGRLPSASDSQ